MKKEEVIFSISDILRGKGKTSLSESPITIGVLLMMGGHGEQTLKQLAQSQNMDFEIKQFIGQLDFEGNIKKCMQDQVHTWINQLSLNSMSDILLLLDKGLVSNAAQDILDTYINLSSRSRYTMVPITPHSINHVVENYFKSNHQENFTFYDGTAGYGISATSFVQKYPRAELNLQEVSVETATILRIRLYLLNVEANIAVADLLEEPMSNEENQMEQFDFVSMSPPWGLKLSEAQVLSMKNDQFNRYVYGIPTRSQGDLAFVSCGLSATKSTGKAAFWLPTGTLFRSGPEQKIRQRLIDLDIIESIILLPTNIHAPYTAISSALLLCNKSKLAERQGKILMINASELGSVNKRSTLLIDEQIERINEIVEQGIEIENISKFIENSDIKEAQLSPESYIYKAEMMLEGLGTVTLNPSALNELDTVPLKDLATFYRGYNATSKEEDPNGEYAILKISDVENGSIHYDKMTRYTITSNAKIDNSRLQQYDLVLSVRGANRKTALVDEERDDLLLSQNFVGIRCNSQLDPEFLQLYLATPIVEFYFNQHTVGSTIQNLPIKEVQQLAVPVLPLEEQQAIVAEHKREQQAIAKELEQLLKRQKVLKLNTIEAMGLQHTFEMKK